MNNLEIQKFFQPLYDDLKEEDEFHYKKPLLAHYTSLNVLERILETDEIWFSNPLFMNDLEEVKFGLSKGVNLVLRSQEIREACLTSDRAKLFRNLFEQRSLDFENNHAFNTYVFCLSEHDKKNVDGLLSMWRGYGSNGNGVAIIFDSAQITPEEDSPFIVGKVHYAPGEKRVDWLEKTLLKFASILGTSDIADDKLYVAAHVLFERIMMFALFSKHDGFKEEREWRVVYIPDRDIGNKCDSMFNYCIGNRGIEPKLRFKISSIDGITSPDLSLENIVDRIILGPTLSSPFTREVVLRMLDRLKKSSFKEKVCVSTIPLRPI